MDIAAIISLISGAVGGNLAGSAFSQKNLGPIVNTIAGLVGGGLGDFILKAFGVFSAIAASSAVGATNGTELDIGQLLASIGVGGASGAALTAALTAIKDALKK